MCCGRSEGLKTAQLEGSSSNAGSTPFPGICSKDMKALETSLYLETIMVGYSGAEYFGGTG